MPVLRWSFNARCERGRPPLHAAVATPTSSALLVCDDGAVFGGRDLLYRPWRDRIRVQRHIGDDQENHDDRRQAREYAADPAEDAAGGGPFAHATDAPRSTERISAEASNTSNLS